ncbi:MAG: hypothetical protein K1X94_33735 [Sandaracinaceae bacterium]|nr:hypothetical protein [Sandaracinaceae bacterium]
MARRILVPWGVTLLSALLLWHAGGCSSSSTLADGGGCANFCNKWVGARCRNGPTLESCLDQCRDEQARCLPEANAKMKCATVEAQIACETGTGQPRVVGCGPREEALSSCMACDRFCEHWSSCPRAPGREECLATCLDPRCSKPHRGFVDCMVGQAVRCADSGPSAPSACISSWQTAQFCTSTYGQEQPFHWLPVQTVDSGTDG